MLPAPLRRRGRLSCPDELAALLRGRADALSRLADEPEELRDALRPVEVPRPEEELRPLDELRPLELRSLDEPRPLVLRSLEVLRPEEELRGLRVPPSSLASPD